jgi:RimJ/RimL family protein N-acetyltransferase
MSAMDIETRALLPDVAPPQRLERQDLLLLRWQPEDLMPRFEAITASFEHIHPWMEWLAEPATVDQQREWGKKDAESWPSADGSCNYGIFGLDGAVLGAIGLHDRLDSGAVEIGYWCHVEHTGRGVITRSAAALTDAAFALPGVQRIEIHCDAANVRSAGVARRLGYKLVGLYPRAIRTPAESGRGMRWVVERSAWPGGEGVLGDGVPRVPGRSLPPACGG